MKTRIKDFRHSPLVSATMVSAFLILSAPAPEESPREVNVDRNRLRTLGTLLNIVSEEMIAVADSENIEEHLISRAETLFDDFAKDADFLGPDRITKPLARKAVRPVVKAAIRYVEKKSQEYDNEQEKSRHE